MRCALRITAIVVAIAATAVPGTAGAASCGTPDPGLDSIWQRVTGGWQAGDAAYSAPLSGRRALWLFGDSLIARNGATIIVRNAAVLARADGSMATVPPTDLRDVPYAATPPGVAASNWLWPGWLGQVDGRLWAFFSEIRRTGPGGWDFRFVGSWLARVDPATLRIRGMRRIVPRSEIAWGAAIAQTARYDYIFGVHDHGSVKHLHVARVSRARGLTGPWRYWDLHRWAKRPKPEAHVLIDVSNQVSVLRLADGYVLITHDPVLGSAVRALRAKSPVGPWRPASVLYHAVPRTPTGITYNAQAHPELPGPGLALSYSVMENATAALPGDPADYRPRFFRVRWSCLGGRPTAVKTPVTRALVSAAGDAGTIPSRPFGESRLAADARGAAVVGWVQAPDPTRPGAALYVSRRPAGGSFGNATRVSPRRHDVLAIGLAAAPSGRSALAWRTGTGETDRRLFLARGSVASGYGRARVIARGLPSIGWSGATEHPADPVVAVANDGTTLVAWLAPSACGYVVQARRAARNGTLGRITTVSRGCPRASTLRAAIDGEGNGAITWRAGRSCGYAKPCNFAIQAAPVRAGATRRPITVSRHAVAAIGLAVAARGGRTVIAWRDAAVVTRELTRGRVMAAVGDRRGFGAPVAVSTADRISGFPAAAAGPHGELLVAWQALASGGGAIEAAFAAPGERFAAPAATGGRTNGFGYRTAPLAVFDAAGTTTVAWISLNGGLRAARRDRDGGWQPSTMEPGPGHAPALAGGATGEAIGLWTGLSEMGQLESLRWQLVP